MKEAATTLSASRTANKKTNKNNVNKYRYDRIRN